MASSYWIKLWIEILDDPKMGKMPDWLWRRTVELFLLAGENGNGGELPSVSDMAWRLRCDEVKLVEALRALERVGVVELLPEGIWKVKNFAKRNEALDVATRKKLSRETARKEGYYGHHGVTKRDTDTEEESDTDTEPESSSAAAAATVRIPATSREAMENPEIGIYREVTGMFPPEGDYRTIVETMQTIRVLKGWVEEPKEKMITYLTPFWNVWAASKRQDGAPYDPTNTTWLVGWAVTGKMPAQPRGMAPKANGNGHKAVSENPLAAELARRKAARENGDRVGS